MPRFAERQGPPGGCTSRAARAFHRPHVDPAYGGMRGLVSTGAALLGVGGHYVFAGGSEAAQAEEAF